MTELKPVHLDRNEVLALRGLRLPAIALKSLQQSGVFCQPAVSIEYQKGAARYVIRGVESGGAVADIGAYCGFVDEAGFSLSVRQPIMSIGVNGLHQAVLSPSLVRIQIFRAATVCELLVTLHRLLPVDGRQRPQLGNSVLFHAKHGRLDPEWFGKDPQTLQGAAPIFSSRSGDERHLPERFHNAIVHATAGACCCGCRHCHLSEPVVLTRDC